MSAAVQPSLRIQQTHGNRQASCLELSGAIDEKFDGAALLNLLAPVTVLDLAKITRITSFGVRQWSDVMKQLQADTKHLYLLNCSPGFIDQLNMVLTFGGRAEVITANGIFFCPKCEDERIATIDVYGDRSRIGTGRLSTMSCPVCTGPLQLSDDPLTYLRFATLYGAKSIDPRAQVLLAASGLYHLRSEGRPPEELKLVHGEVTVLCLSGMLDQRFQPRRLASGVEGDVVFDLSGADGVDATGCERWARVLSQLKNVKQVVLVDVPEPLWQPILDGQFNIDGTVLHSLRVALECPSCHTPEQASIVDGATVDKPRPCPRCANPLLPKFDAALMARVFERIQSLAVPIPSTVQDVIARRDELLAQARAIDGHSTTGPASGVTATRYKLIRQLSKGGMGEVLLAVREGIGGFEKLVALKKIRRDILALKDAAAERFVAEARLAGNLNHPNIVQVFEVGQQGGDLFIAMEYIHGADLRTLMRDTQWPGRKPLPLPELLFIGKQIASALHHAHTASDLDGRPLGIVHRDVTPSNIVVGFDGQVKLVDFGIALAHALGERPAGLVGKVRYMSPEQVANQPLDGRSDVFSLGVVLYELILRRALFRRENDEQTTRAVWTDPLPPLKKEGVPDFVERALGRALERMADARYPDAHAFDQALAECLERMGARPTSQDLATLLKERFPTESATPPVERGTESKQRATNYLDVVPVDEPQTAFDRARRPTGTAPALESDPSGPLLTPTELAALKPVIPSELVPAPGVTPAPVNETASTEKNVAYDLPPTRETKPKPGWVVLGITIVAAIVLAAVIMYTLRT